MNETDTNMRVARIFDEAAALVREKNPKYGSSWRHQGWRGNLSRILEKSGRLRSMLWRRDPELLSASKEHPRETMLDMMNTLAFAIINMDDHLEYGHEVPGEPFPAPPQPGNGGLIPSDNWPDANQPSSDLALSYGRPELDHTANTAIIDGLSAPGEERPTPQPRAKVTDRGSGPRKRPVKDAPQA